MAGIYVHIPFCRRACHYCDFHFSTNTRHQNELVNAIVQEAGTQQSFLGQQQVGTIYFGGGTPSMLPSSSISSILDAIRKNYQVSEDVEVTLEANPEDLRTQKLKELKGIGINRLSLGTQSFIAQELQWMNRMHTPEQARTAISEAQDVGFDNISIDLIFGVPEQSLPDWEHNLSVALKCEVQHISSYGLTVETRTKLHHNISKGNQLPPDEGIAEACFRMNMEVLPANGFAHYEISNFAKEGFVSRHNSAYWQQVPYLGLGPSAHSYDGSSRRWNIRSNAAYIKGITNGAPAVEQEVLTTNDRINEHIMTGLRCKWGIQRVLLDAMDKEAWPRIVQMLPPLGLHNFHVDNDRITLSNEGKLMADRLAAELFI